MDKSKKHEYIVKKVNSLLLKHGIIQSRDRDNYMFTVPFLKTLKNNLRTKSLSNSVAASLIHHAPEVHNDELATMGCGVVTYLNACFPEMDMSEFDSSTDVDTIVSTIYDKLKFLNENK